MKITGCRATVSAANSFYQINTHCPDLWDGKGDKNGISQETCHHWIDDAFEKKAVSVNLPVPLLWGP